MEKKLRTSFDLTRKKFRTSFYISGEARAILKRLIVSMGINRSAIIEVLLRQAKKEGLS